ncbi:MAG: BrnT family toxin [Myxococcota bacterium]
MNHAIFEFDIRKSSRNREKHGLDFVQVQALWVDDNRLEVPARTEDEPRFLVIGQIEGKHWTVVVTYRGEKTRIISARRSREEEVERYESQ